MAHGSRLRGPPPRGTPPRWPTAYVYQGEELGLPEVEDLPEALLQDPTWERSRRTVRGRDGCRVPMPWSGDEPPFGFAPEGVRPWLPRPRQWRALTVEAQDRDPRSVLALYLAALQLHRRTADLHTGDLLWRDVGLDVLAFDRGARFRCLVNLSAADVPLAGHGELVLGSDPDAVDALPPDTAAWLRRGGGRPRR